MSKDASEEASEQAPEYERLLRQVDTPRTVDKDSQRIQPVERCPVHDRFTSSVYNVPRSIQEVSSPTTTADEQSSRSVMPPPSIVVDDASVNSDDPPPYTAIPPPNHIGWSYDFSHSGIPYSVHAGPPRIAETSLASFQASLASSANVRPDVSRQHSTIQLPFTPYRFFKFGSNRTLFTPEDTPVTDTGIAAKTISGKSRRYGAILVAGAVIVFLMALSLMVRFVVERSFWRG